MLKVYGEYFYGNKISNYGLENGYVDYATLAKSFNCILNDTIANIPGFWDYAEQISGHIDNSDEIETLNDQIEECEAALEEAEDPCVISEIERDIEGMQQRINDLEFEEDQDVLQWYLVSKSGADILQECNEIVYYNSELNIYLWAVTHYGTSWDYVLTNIKCNTREF